MAELTPNKSLGQHWLFDKTSLDSIVDSVEVTEGDLVLEIGPGLGTLTEVLLARGASVIAVEFDDKLADKLRAKELENLQVVNEDILKFDFGKLKSEYKIVANIPYYLTNNLLRLISELDNPPQRASLLVQKEVALRASALPGDMSVLSVSLQFYNKVSTGILVPADLFTPPPKVDSQVLILERHKEPLFSDVDPAKYFRLVKAGFSQKRKKLRSSLSAGLAVNKQEIENICTQAGLNYDLRPQNLSLTDWHELYKAFYGLNV